MLAGLPVQRTCVCWCSRRPYDANLKLESWTAPLFAPFGTANSRVLVLLVPLPAVCGAALATAITVAVAPLCGAPRVVLLAWGMCCCGCDDGPGPGCLLLNGGHSASGVTALPPGGWPAPRRGDRPALASGPGRRPKPLALGPKASVLYPRLLPDPGPQAGGLLMIGGPPARPLTHAVNLKSLIGGCPPGNQRRARCCLPVAQGSGPLLDSGPAGLAQTTVTVPGRCPAPRLVTGAGQLTAVRDLVAVSVPVR